MGGVKNVTDTLKRLEREYDALFERERALQRGSNAPLQMLRRRFIDCLYDDFLSKPDFFQIFSAVGGGIHEDNRIVVDYGPTNGYSQPLDQYGAVSQYQYIIFSDRGPFWWDPSFLVLHDQKKSQIQVYMITSGYTHGEPQRIGTEHELEVVCEKRFSTTTERGSMRVKEMSREALCDPMTYFRLDEQKADQGRVFNAFYLGIQTFAQQCLEKTIALQGLPRRRVTAAELERSYAALKVLAGQEK